MLLGSTLAPFVLKQKLPKYTSIGEIDVGYTIEKNPRLIMIYRHFGEYEITFSSYEIWDRFASAVVAYFQNKEEKKQLHLKLDDGFTADTSIKKGSNNVEHYYLKLTQGSKFVEIYFYLNLYT